MSEQDDWRLASARSIKGAVLKWSRYRQPRPAWDHDHCVACWAKFAEFEGPDIQHEGYATLDEYNWVCAVCFRELKEVLDWKLASPDSA